MNEWFGANIAYERAGFRRRVVIWWSRHCYLSVDQQCHFIVTRYSKLVRNFIICTHPQLSLGISSEGEWGGRGMWHAWQSRENFTRFWWESPKERDRSEDQHVDGRMESEWMLGKLVWGVWIGFDWLRLGTGGWLLWVRWWTFGFLLHGVSNSKLMVWSQG
jgi:hypothetical protein